MAWYAIALEKDLPPGTVMPGKIKDEELAVWRTNNGKVKVFSDRCPHRGMRLSHGFVRKDKLNCIYHGWQYNGDGNCSFIPAHPSLDPPASICVKKFHCLEQDGVIWVSFGERENSPPKFVGFSAVRSLEIEVNQAAVSMFFGNSNGNVIYAGKASSFLLLLQPETYNRCFVHLLTTQDLSYASEWIEDQRMIIEAIYK